MAGLEPLTMDVEINTRLVDFPIEWKVLPILQGVVELQRWLNTFSEEGWDVFQILPGDSSPGFVVVLRREIKTPDESLDD